MHSIPPILPQSRRAQQEGKGHEQENKGEDDGYGAEASRDIQATVAERDGGTWPKVIELAGRCIQDKGKECLRGHPMHDELYCTCNDGIMQGQISGRLGQVGSRWIRLGVFGVGLHDSKGV